MPIDGKFELTKDVSYNIYGISKQTMELHHGKHLATYVNNLNALIAGTEWEGRALEDIVKYAPEGPILNNAGQVLNHNMYFGMLIDYDFQVDRYVFPEEGEIIRLICTSLYPEDKDLFEADRQQEMQRSGNPEYAETFAPFHSLYRSTFKKKFLEAGLTLFGSGWVWLSLDNEGKFVITQEPNAMNPLRRGLHPLLTIDVWEHAYYLDYQNRRAEYLEKVWNTISWGGVYRRYKEVIAEIFPERK